VRKVLLRVAMLLCVVATIVFATIDQHASKSLTLTVYDTNGTVSLTWNPSTTKGVTGYDIYRSTISGGYYASIGSTAGDVYTYTDNPGPGTYYYVATAILGDEQSAYSNQVSITVP
jgi:fibronectin type 3 domain-containing protein